MYDVIIVGAGIAGSTVARSLDCNVLILQKNKKVLPKDSGIVSRKFVDHYGTKFVRHEITEMELVPPNGNSFFLRDEKPFAHILHRERLAKFCIREAKKHADMRNETLVSMENGESCVTVRTNKSEYQGRMLVGCDGATSSVRKLSGIPAPRLSIGMMIKESGLKKGHIKTFFCKKYSPDFFSWVIPQSDEYGLMAGSGAMQCMKNFVYDMEFRPGKTYAYMIPTGMTKSFGNRCILVGDACGQNKPLTGGGIVFSATGAGCAASVINDAVSRKRFDSKFLSQYEKSWKQEIAWEIRKQIIVRNIYSRLSDDDVNSIFRKFGHHMERLRNFDYDKFSRSWVNMPKKDLLIFAFSNTWRLF